jgi:putative ABC transport system permease protein
VLRSGAEHNGRSGWWGDGRVPLARRNLVAEKARFAMSVAGVAFSVVLVLIVVSLYRGWGEVGGFFEQLPGNAWVTQAGTGDPLRSTSYVDAGAVPAIQGMEGVRSAIPVYARSVVLRAGDRHADALLMGLAVPNDASVPADVRARVLPAAGNVVISGSAADALRLGVGDAVTVLDRTLTVERVQRGGTRMVDVAFANAVDAAALLEQRNRVSYVLLDVAPSAATRAVRDVPLAAPGTEVHTADEFSRAFAKRVDDTFLPVVGVLVAIGFVVGGGVIALMTYTATIEKARDFAVLKAIGATDAYVYRIVVQQSVLVGAIGAAIGVAVAALAADAIPHWVHEFVTDLRPTDAAVVFGVSLLAALAAAVVPVRRINRIDPATVFRA